MYLDLLMNANCFHLANFVRSVPLTYLRTLNSGQNEHTWAYMLFPSQLISNTWGASVSHAGQKFVIVVSNEAFFGSTQFSTDRRFTVCGCVLGAFRLWRDKSKQIFAAYLRRKSRVLTFLRKCPANLGFLDQKHSFSFLMIFVHSILSTFNSHVSIK